MRRYGLSDEHWNRIKTLLPRQPDDPGVTAADNRLIGDTLLWIARSGAPPGAIFPSGLAIGTPFGEVSIVGLSKESGSESFSNFRILTWSGCFSISLYSRHIPMQLVRKGAKNESSWPFAWRIWHQNPSCSQRVGQSGRISIKRWPTIQYHSYSRVD